MKWFISLTRIQISIDVKVNDDVCLPNQIKMIQISKAQVRWIRGVSYFIHLMLIMIMSKTSVTASVDRSVLQVLV